MLEKFNLKSAENEQADETSLLSKIKQNLYVEHRHSVETTQNNKTSHPD